MKRETIESIVAAGVWAPSADNRHQFRARLHDDALELLATDEFTADTERHRRVLTLIAFGAVIENMVLRAARLGSEAKVAWRPDAADQRLLARIDFVPGPAADDALQSAIETRATNRRMYRGPGPDEAQRVQMASDTAAAGNAALHWMDGEARRRVHALVWLAESERFRRPRLHEELFAAVRFDAGWRDGTAEALPPVALEVEAPMRPMFAALRHWRLMRAMHLLGGHRMLGLRAGLLPCLMSPALAVVSAASQDEVALVAAGRGLQRAWLRATALGLAVQPLAASAVLALQDDNAPGGIAASARERLRSDWQLLLPGRTPVIVLRVGRAAAPSGRAGRLPVDRYLAGAATG